jgi:hypothetical protein
MKNPGIRRFLAVAVASQIGLLMLSGCSQSSRQQVWGGASKNAASTKPPITVSIGIQSANCTLGDGTHQNCSVLADITKQTGITLNFVTYDEDKFKVLVAGGDLPDVYSIETDAASTVTSSLIKSGAILPLDSLLAKYGQNIEKNIPTGLKWSKKVIGNGKTYIIPNNTSIKDTNNPKVQGWVGFFSRYDIYKAIGSPKISGEASYLNVLKKMQDYQRKKTGKNNIYALSSWTDWGLWPYWVSYPFSYGFKDANYNHMVNMATGEVQDQFLDANGIFWDSLRFYNEAYRMGIFDPEGLVMKYNDYTNKITNGTVLTSDAEWLQPDVKTCGSKALNTVFKGAFPVVSELYPLDDKIGYGEGGAVCINAKTKYADRIMQMLNWFNSQDGARTITNGVEGVDWHYVNGKAQLMGPRLKAIQNNTITAYEKAHPTGIGATFAGTSCVYLAQFFSTGSIKTTDGQPVDLALSRSFLASVATPLQKSYAHDFDKTLSFPGEVYDKWVKTGAAKSPATVPLGVELIAPLSTTSQQAENNAAQYITDYVSKIIMAKNVTAFNTVKASAIAAIKKMGDEAADKEFVKNYTAAKKLASSFK